MGDPTPPYSRYTRSGEDGPDIGLYLQAVGEDAKDWFEAQKALTRLEVSEQLGRLASNLILVAVAGLIATTALMLWFVALALWFGQLLANNALGFLLAGGLFLLIGALFFLVWRTVLRDKVTLTVINAIHGTD
ncbi:MAG: phage holin family protein [Flavobacteriales bacterium]|nr:phage holin family protein [Flavobacteriales bacterium]